MTELYLVRHGETDWSRQHRIQGLTDIPLNATGRRQARTTRRLVSRRTWDGIYASAWVPIDPVDPRTMTLRMPSG